ncbi:MAG: response regulator, partial [Cyanobacteria bacterium J083]
MDTLNTQTDNNQPVNQSSQTVKIRVLIVDDQKIIREGLKVLIQSEADFEVIGTGASGEDAIKLTRQLKPDVILLDVEMPGIDGVTATKQIISEFPEAKILVLSSYDSDKYVSESLDAGAKGYLLKGTPAHEVRDAVRAAYRGYLQIGPSLFDKVMPGNTQSLAQIQDSLPKIRAGGLSIQTDEESSLAETEETGRVVVKPKADISSRFDQPVVLKQSPWAARAAIGTIIGVVLFSMGWSAFAKIEQVVKAKGQLKPKEAVKEINTPVTGVVEKVLVKDGDQVEQDQTLLVFDTDASQAQLQSLNNIRKSLIQENKFYRTLMREPLDTSVVERAIIQLKIPQEVAFLARNRNELIAENNLYQVQLGGSRAIANLRPDELARLRANQAELNSRARAAKLEVEQIEKQLNQNQVQLADAREQLRRDRQVLREIVARNRQAIAQAEASLKIEESILADVSPLLEEGALAKVQIERQKQEVSDRKARLVEQRASGQIEYEKQEQQIQNRLEESDRLLEEEKRRQLDV